MSNKRSDYQHIWNEKLRFEWSQLKRERNDGREFIADYLINQKQVISFFLLSVCIDFAVYIPDWPTDMNNQTEHMMP